jgi:ABC-2 type transport system permease protein
MLRALLYLKLTSLKNRAQSQLRRLRQPKYLAGTLFVIAYFWFFFFRHVSSVASPALGANMLGALPGDISGLITAALALLLSLYLAQMWILPSDSPGIKFSPAEIAFLFPAPLSRRSLIHYKVLSLQLSSLVQSCFFSLVFNHRNLLQGRAAETLVGWWVILTLVSLHQLGSSLTIAKLAAQGLHTHRRRIFALGLGLAIAMTVGFRIWRSLPPTAQSTSASAWLTAIVSSGPLHWLLWPARIMLAPSFAHTHREFFQTLAPVLLILIAHYFWVIRTEVSFEEASLAASERLASRLADLQRNGGVAITAPPTSGRRPPFNVAHAPWPELAFLWKNLISTARSWFTARVWLGSATTLVLVVVVLERTMGETYWMAGGVIAGLGAFTTGLTLLYGPLLTRLDLRQDLINADILRTYPLPGWRILLGELLAPVVVLSGIIWFGLLAWFLGLHSHQPPALSAAWFSPSMRIVLVACAALLAPLVVTLQLLVPNGAVILFPAMFRTAQTPGPSVDLMGQRMLFGFGQLCALAVVFLPALGLAVASYFGLSGLLVIGGLLGMVTQTSPAPFTAEVVGTLVMFTVLTAEIWCGIWWLGGRFEKIDLSAEVHP